MSLNQYRIVFENCLKLLQTLKPVYTLFGIVSKSAFPDTLVKNYENLIPSLNPPDEKDRHVGAAAMKSNSNCIVTNNLKDFPQDILGNFEIPVISADDFLVDIIDLNHEQAISAFKEMVLNRKNPRMDEYEVLNQLRKCGLKKTANFLERMI